MGKLLVKFALVLTVSFFDPIGESAPVPTIRSESIVTVESARVKLIKQATPSETKPGGRIDYTLTVASLQLLSRVQITLSDKLPDGVTLDKDSVTVSTPQGRLTVTNDTVKWEWPEQPLPVPVIINFTAQVRQGTGGQTMTNVVEMEICQKNKSKCNRGSTKVDTKINKPEVTCLNDIKLITASFQPVQVVWNDKENPILDKKYLAKIDPKFWTTTIPLVQNKKTLLFGIKNEKGRDYLHFTVLNNFNENKQVALVFSVEYLSGNVQRLFATRQGRLISPSATPGPLLLPGASITDTCVGSRTEIFIDAPSIDTKKLQKPFVLTEEQEAVTIQVEVTGFNFERIVDANPDNQIGLFGADQKQTRDFSVLIKPLVFRNASQSESLNIYGPPLIEITRVLNSFLPGVYPLKEATQYARFTTEPERWAPENENIDSLNGWMTHLRGISGSDANQTATLQENEADRLLKKLAVESLPESWTGHYDRMVLIAEPQLLSTFGGYIGWAFSKKVVMVSWNQDATAAVHELTHTMPYLWSEDEMTQEFGVNYHNDKGTMAQGNGYWVNQDSLQTSKLGIMGPPIGPFTNFWIEQPTYKHLVKEFSKPMLDPIVLGIRGILSDTGTLELPPWYVLEGDVDLLPGSVGTHSLILLDDQGKVLETFGFTPEFRGHADPMQEDIIFSTSVVGFRVPYTENISRVEFRDEQGTLLGFREVSPSAPTVELRFPVGGETISQASPQVLRWEGHDADGDALSYIVLYSPDLGETWFPLDSDVQSQELALDPSLLDPGDGYLLKVLVSDGLLTHEVVSEPFSIVP